MADLTPAQQRTLDALRRPADLPDFADIGQQLHEHAVRAVDPLVDRWVAARPGEILRMTKWRMTGCEKRRVEEVDQFDWNVPKAAGTLAHEMIQLWLYDPRLRPAALWDHSTNRLIASERGLGPWLASLSVEDTAELRQRCESQVVQFVEVFPPPTPQQSVAVEAVQQWQVVRPAAPGGPPRTQLLVTGKVDLQFGRDTDTHAGVIFVELKAEVRDSTYDELRLYALLRALRLGTPPRAVAAMALSTGRVNVMPVTQRMLEDQLVRLLAAIEAEVTLAEGRPPTVETSALCAYCTLWQQSCTPGREHLIAIGKVRP